ncbi:hypothetical protein [Streptomyces indicus]|uniref:Uncharacterized protein n=1 Tax=Streptomyces indicus TaxID=417292 RepID=A0A1G9EIH2_9ACTN|nr:hypothetical protein [Streptomyces indicus]SDK75942.1 hypothetical protein SAMN05421806_111193 [Streptomyces indicus]
MILFVVFALLVLGFLCLCALALLGYFIVMIILSCTTGERSGATAGWRLAALTIGLPLTLIAGGAVALVSVAQS